MDMKLHRVENFIPVLLRKHCMTQVSHFFGWPSSSTENVALRYQQTSQGDKGGVSLSKQEPSRLGTEYFTNKISPTFRPSKFSLFSQVSGKEPRTLIPARLPHSPHPTAVTVTLCRGPDRVMMKAGGHYQWVFCVGPWRAPPKQSALREQRKYITGVKPNCWASQRPHQR